MIKGMNVFFYFYSATYSRASFLYGYFPNTNNQFKNIFENCHEKKCLKTGGGGDRMPD